MHIYEVMPLRVIMPSPRTMDSLTKILVLCMREPLLSC